jgi:4-hydroxyphenylpyruvate dioxygenase
MSTVAQARPGALDRLYWYHVHFYVGNAKQAAHYYCTALGFELQGYAGPETGQENVVSYLVVQNHLRFVLSASLVAGSDVARWVNKHGDGVRDVALRVPDARAAFETALAGGATAVTPPVEVRDEHGTIVYATIAGYGETIHTFVERDNYRGRFGPNFVPASGPKAPHAAGLRNVDHIVGNVGWNEMDTWAAFYGRAFGFSQLVSFDDTDISTEFTALRSKVMSDADRRVKFPINEPAKGLKRSQIEEYLDYNGGAGVQHIAIGTDDIISTVRALGANGVQFLETPASYYDALTARVGDIDEAVESLRELSILVDRDDLGYMLQIFTKPLQDRPTLFFEIIQRKGSLSFGKGNFKALFVAIENEQARRGTL